MTTKWLVDIAHSEIQGGVIDSSKRRHPCGISLTNGGHPTLTPESLLGEHRHECGDNGERDEDLAGERKQHFTGFDGVVRLDDEGGGRGGAQGASRARCGGIHQMLHEAELVPL